LALVVDYHETQFLQQLNQENQDSLDNPDFKLPAVPIISVSFDRYAYAFNNPLVYSDPTGHNLYRTQRFTQNSWAVYKEMIRQASGSLNVQGDLIGISVGAVAAGVLGFAGFNLPTGNGVLAGVGVCLGAVIGGVAAYVGGKYVAANIDSVSSMISIEAAKAQNNNQGNNKFEVKFTYCNNGYWKVEVGDEVSYIDSFTYDELQKVLDEQVDGSDYTEGDTEADE
jgi:hypothetical protein